MLSKDLEVTLNEAFRTAKSKRHEVMTVEHLLLALLDNAVALDVLAKVGADVERLRKDLLEHIDATTPLIPAGDSDRETQPTLGFQRVLQRAVCHVQSSGKKEVVGANVLVAMFGEQESQAIYLLQQQNVSRLDVVNYISHGITKVASVSEEVKDPGRNLPLGVFRNFEYGRLVIQPKPGDTLLFMSDGLMERFNADVLPAFRDRQAA